MVQVQARVDAEIPRYLDRVARRRRAVLGDVIGSLGVLGAALALALWVQGGGIQSLTGVAGWWTGIGRASGLLAAYLLLIQVLLMARIPWLEGVWGQDVLVRRHRWVGFTSFHLMLLHIVAITIGYAATAQDGFLHEGWVLITVYPGMMLATAGTLCLIAVVVTSIRRARRRLRYESWHLIHLYAYLGVGLALPHQLWTGADFSSSAAVTVFWWGLWGAAAAGVISFRFVVPAIRSLRHRVVVDRVVVEGPGVVSVWMTGRKLDRLGITAGQFCHWRFLGPGWTRANPFTVSAVPTDRRLRITVRTDGDGGRRIAAVRPGTAVLFEGPYGRSTADRRQHRDVLLIGAGVGVTPLRGLAEDIAMEPPTPGPTGVRAPSVMVLHRISGPGNELFAAEFAGLATRADVEIQALPGARNPNSAWWGGAGPLDPATALRRLVPDLAARDVYLCGPEDWMAQVRDTLRQLGTPRSTIHSERFAW